MSFRPLQVSPRAARCAPLLLLGGCLWIDLSDLGQHGGSSPSGAGPPDDTGAVAVAETATVDDALGDSPVCVPGVIDVSGANPGYVFAGANPGDLLLVSTQAASLSPASPADTVLTTEDGSTADDSLFGRAGTDSDLVVPVGTRVEVTDHDPEAAGSDHVFQVCARLVPAGDVEPNDSPSEASALSAPPDDDLLVTSGDATADADTFALPTLPDGVYRVALVPGAAPSGALLHLQAEDGVMIQSSSSARFDDRSLRSGYPPAAPLMFVGGDGTSWLRVDGSTGRYVLAVQALPNTSFPREVELNDDLAHAQTIPLLRQSDGSYRNAARGTLTPGADEVDTFLLDPAAQEIEWSGSVLDLYVQSASVGTDQDLAVRLTDPDSGGFVGLYQDDPGGLFGTDPVVLRLPLEDHPRLEVEVLLVDDPAPSSDPWFLTLTVTPL